MGGFLPEQSDSATFRRVLDIGGGSGNWLIETAKRPGNPLGIETIVVLLLVASPVWG